MVDRHPSTPSRIEADLVPNYESPEDDFVINGKEFPEFARKMHIARENRDDTLTQA